MIISREELFEQALKLSPIEKTQLIEHILGSFDFEAMEKIENDWALEAEERLKAAKKGSIEKIPANEVFSSLNV